MKIEVGFSVVVNFKIGEIIVFVSSFVYNLNIIVRGVLKV